MERIRDISTEDDTKQIVMENKDRTNKGIDDAYGYKVTGQDNAKKFFDEDDDYLEDFKRGTVNRSTMRRKKSSVASFDDIRIERSASVTSYTLKEDECEADFEEISDDIKIEIGKESVQESPKPQEDSGMSAESVSSMVEETLPRRQLFQKNKKPRRLTMQYSLDEPAFIDQIDRDETRESTEEKHHTKDKTSNLDNDDKETHTKEPKKTDNIFENVAETTHENNSKKDFNDPIKDSQINSSNHEEKAGQNSNKDSDASKDVSTSKDADAMDEEEIDKPAEFRRISRQRSTIRRKTRPLLTLKRSISETPAEVVNEETVVTKL